MKWLFLLLLIINFGIFAWGYQQEQQEKQPTIAAGADIGNMRLINEKKEEQKQDVVESTQEPDIEIAKAETVTSEMLEQPVANTAEANEDTQQTNTEVAENSESPQLTEASADPNAIIKSKEQLTALDSDKPDSDNIATDEKAVEAKSETTSRCGTIGPLKDRQVATKVLEDLQKSQLEAKIEQSVEKKQIGYWVVIPPLADGSQAQAKIDQLTKVGLKDIWHFRGGGLKNAISLGMFSKKENAENFSREVLAKGFKTEMQPRYLNKKNYLVKFTITKPKTVTGLMWRMVERKYSKMPFSEQSCEAIATR